MSSAPLLDYYGQRAREYERIYDKPERQADLARLRLRLRELLRGQRVLELACGTGYWTAALADAAETILATDAGTEVLDLASAKQLPPAKVSFAQADAYHPGGLPGRFTAGFAAFWWSHVPLARLPEFLENFHAALRPDSLVVLADNRFVPGGSTPIHRSDPDGNTYQLRYLQDGSTHEVLKNFPTAGELQARLAPYAKQINVKEFDYFWCASYHIRSS